MKFLQRFFSSDISGGIVLIIAAVLAMFCANLDVTKAGYQAFLDTPVAFKFAALEINKNMLLWINDALMAVFFLMVGLEVKYELMQGSLASRQQAIFPVIAALGGMVAPALIFLAFNMHDPLARHGWAIPAATDIAFALGVLALLGDRIPPALKIFLMALAIIDDLGAIIIIALFYTSDLSLVSLGVAAAAIVALAVLNALNVRRIGIYMLVGIVLWTAVLKSGIHATLAGVVLGFFIPLKEENGVSPARQVIDAIHPWVGWLILPLFAFANAGVSLEGVTFAGLTSLLPMGVIAGLFIGKPVGITIFCWLALRLKLAKLPQGAAFKQIMAVGVLCGIGFTMSIFIATLAFGDVDTHMVAWAKLGILTGSILAAVVGYCLLRSRIVR
ncbi:MAG: Na+/H+ antiporter NhaA [Streptococcus vestibularis]|uniref:Na(+)/H(+) antiporter NhaA n=2 Tax=Bacteria TaxID=2 RepID=A0A943LX09_STRVE|nr:MULTISPECIES: Na+/H+ antiporter NhaA [Enterobacteriaceae]AUU89276.1 Na+/H+ antiporter NhaA [Enterobacteriaceae bacterium ENNIH3]AUV05387.1 Na+/H+ antiporter NhaA [Enterobacteriaceae bacterium ENNIH2]MBS6097092.1 Na+/H+ antiporter NhaA [Streptococcus vestibularis]MBS6736576.1 Na+/H+ antiporter NhaA [Enterobacteriaceae bacterium]PWF52253.1 Na+/H+ antiporter NhaA [[Kluyvera] intestini]PXW59381.1 sodium/proton antiporter (NhaA family) [Grimontella sp. AG753]